MSVRCGSFESGVPDHRCRTCHMTEIQNCEKVVIWLQSEVFITNQTKAPFSPPRENTTTRPVLQIHFCTSFVFMKEFFVNSLIQTRSASFGQYLMLITSTT
ncbi:hypothetical protein TNCV_1446801 [Trichonephila clavipes]|nr:hypothetical protein TNCV_1446801 [Trichonephila clavipes]